MLCKRGIFAFTCCAVLALGNPAPDAACPDAAAKAAIAVKAQSAAEAFALSRVATIEQLVQGLKNMIESRNVTQTQIERHFAAEEDDPPNSTKSEVKSVLDGLHQAHDRRLERVHALEDSAIQAALELVKTSRRSRTALRDAGEHERAYEDAYNRAAEVSENFKVRAAHACGQAVDLVEEVYMLEVQREAKRAREQQARDDVDGPSLPARGMARRRRTGLVGRRCSWLLILVCGSLSGATVGFVFALVSCQLSQQALGRELWPYAGCACAEK